MSVFYFYGLHGKIKTMNIFEWIFQLLLSTSGVWFPLLVVYFAWKYGKKWWAEYIMKEALLAVEWVLLEIQAPQDVHKTPQAMEMIIASLAAGTPAISNLDFSGLKPENFADFYNAYWKGEIFANFASLEIVSIEGSVRFFIRVPKKSKAIVEHVIYSQFSKAEVREAVDYTSLVPAWEPGGDWNIDAAEWVLTKDDAYPIKTYVDWGLDNKSLSLDEDQKIDPLGPLIEALAALGQGEQLWIQIVIRQATKKKKPDGSYKDWVSDGQDFIKKIIKDHSNTEITIKKDDKEEKQLVGGYKNLSPLDQDVVDAVQRSIQKPGFDTGIRAIYITKKDQDKKRMGVIKTAFNHFNSQNLNSLKASGAGFAFPWEDYGDRRKNKQLSDYFKLYVYRSFFYPPAKDKKIFIMNTEELATIFHFPGKTISTPSFTRIDSQKAEPPANLPI